MTRILRLFWRGFAPKRDSGFALIAILWICGLIAVVSTALVLEVRAQLLTAQRIKSTAELGSIADSTALALANQLALLPEQPLRAISNGSRRTCKWSSDIEVTVSIQDQAGLVDLNTSTPVLLTSLLRGLGSNSTVADRISSEMLDFKDQDKSSAISDASTETYPSPEFQPKNSPFEMIEELDQIPSISDDMLQSIIPLVTVHSQQTGFDGSTAPENLTKVLSSTGLSDQSMQALKSPSPLKTFAIEVHTFAGRNRHLGRNAIVTLLRQPERPFALLSWSIAQNLSRDQAGLSGSQPCLN